MDLIEDIGPILGIVAFLGFAILALLIVLQAREVRRLREWAGRAPERALEADEAALAASEEAGTTSKEEQPSRAASFRERVGERYRSVSGSLGRSSPVDPRIVLGALLLGLAIAAVLTSGFGLVGDDSEPVASGGAEPAGEPVEVAVLNATERAGVAPPTPGIADFVAEEIVKPAGFKTGIQADAPAGEDKSVILFEPEAEDDADALAEAVSEDLGPTDTREMAPAVRDEIGGSPLALLVGFDDSAIADDATAP